MQGTLRAAHIDATVSESALWWIEEWEQVDQLGVENLSSGNRRTGVFEERGGGLRSPPPAAAAFVAG